MDGNIQLLPDVFTRLHLLLTFYRLLVKACSLFLLCAATFHHCYEIYVVLTKKSACEFLDVIELLKCKEGQKILCYDLPWVYPKLL